jgi:peptide-O-fucosyltransferase
MRESELRALYLLKKQQLSLFSLWNSTGNSTLLEKDLNSVSFEDLKSALLKQISLNKEIQQVLLAPHESGNVSSSSSDLDFSNAGGFVQRCEKVDQRFADRKTIEWKPKPNKFLFALCLSGQMSNHLICLEKHMFFAALLNRVLVIPSSRFDYQYNRVLDIEHVNDCLGRKVVVTFEEFVEIMKNKPHIDRFFCYFSDPTPCYVDEEHVKKLKGLGVSMGKLESPWKEDIKKPSKLTVKDVEGKFVSDDNVIAVGDVFFADVEEEWIMQPGGPIAHKCKTLIEPTRIIMLTAQRFIQTFLGSNFIALHFRRHGFLKFWYVLLFSCLFLYVYCSWCFLPLCFSMCELFYSVYCHREGGDGGKELLHLSSV